jgi:enediyne biosynthesis protein E4
VDLVIGNYGLNSQLKASDAEPVQIYYSDFDHNGNLDPIMTSFIQGKSYPFAAMDDILKQVPFLRKKFYDYPVYADASINDLLAPDQLASSKKLHANIFETICLQNTGHGFKIKHLPIEAQYGPVYSIISADVNKDGFKDLILFGNNKFNRIRLGRDDANHGIVLINNGQSDFSYLQPCESGITIKGDVRSALIVGGQLFVAVNNDSLKTFTIKKP